MIKVLLSVLAFMIVPSVCLAEGAPQCAKRIYQVCGHGNSAQFKGAVIKAVRQASQKLGVKVTKFNIDLTDVNRPSRYYCPTAVPISMAINPISMAVNPDGFATKNCIITRNVTVEVELSNGEKMTSKFHVDLDGTFLKATPPTPAVAG